MVFDKYYQVNSSLNDNQVMITFGCVYDIPWIFKWSYVINLNIGLMVHRLLRQASIKQWQKFDVDRIAKDVELPIPPFFYDPNEYEASQRKLKTALRGIPRNEILDFLKTHSDTETMQGSDDNTSDPFGGPCSQPQ